MSKFFLSWLIVMVCHNTMFCQHLERIEMFLTSLDPGKRELAIFDYDDPGRLTWLRTSGSRNGIAMFCRDANITTRNFIE